MDDSWTDSNLNRVSVIQFQEETKAEEEDDEAAAERRVRKQQQNSVTLCPLHVILLIVIKNCIPSSETSSSPNECELSYCFCFRIHGFNQFGFFFPQGLQRRATPHPSELKVMKKVIEERRNEAYTSRPDGEESPNPQVHTSYCIMIIISRLSAASYLLI